MKSRLPLGLTVLGLVLLANAAALMYPPLGYPSGTACDNRMAILCAELPPDGAALASVLSDPANPLEAWRHQILLDLPFLFLYALMLAGGGWRENEGRALRIAGAVFAFAGGALDAVENFGILDAIAQVGAGLDVPDALADRVRIAATAKFTALCFACVITCSAAVRPGSSRWTRAALGVPLALGVVGLASPLSPAVVNVAGVAIVAACFALWSRAVYAWWTSRGASAA